MARKKRSVAQRLADRNAQIRDVKAQLDQLRDILESRVYAAVFSAMIEGGAHVTDARKAAEKFAKVE